MVEALDAVVARGAVHGARRPKNAAGVAVAQADDETIYHLLLLLLYVGRRCLCVDGTPRDGAGVAAGGGPESGDGDEVEEHAAERNGGGQRIQRLCGGTKEQDGGNADDGEGAEAIVYLWTHHEAPITKEPVGPLPRAERHLLGDAAMLGGEHSHASEKASTLQEYCGMNKRLFA